MKRLLLCLMVVPVYASSNWFFATEVQVSNYWRATQTTPVEELESFISGEDELFISGEDDHTAPVEDEHTAIVEIEDLLIDEQEEQGEAEESAGVIFTPDEIEEQAEPVEIENQAEWSAIETEGN